MEVCNWKNLFQDAKIANRLNMADHISAILDGELCFLHPYTYILHNHRYYGTIDVCVPHPFVNHDNLAYYHSILV